MFERPTLEQKLQINPYHPFTLNVRKGNDNLEGIFTCIQKPRRFYYFVISLAITISLLLFVLTASDIGNPYFLILMCSMLVCLLGMYHSRNKIIYTINHKTSLYQVKCGDNISVNSLHNIYIRLMKINLPSLQKSATVRYQIYIKGYKMESIFIGEMTTKSELRLLGQYLAQNLNLNYFDDSNTSEHHVIRHISAK